MNKYPLTLAMIMPDIQALHVPHLEVDSEFYIIYKHQAMASLDGRTFRQVGSDEPLNLELVTTLLVYHGHAVSRYIDEDGYYVTSICNEAINYRVASGIGSDSILRTRGLFGEPIPQRLQLNTVESFEIDLFRLIDLCQYTSVYRNQQEVNNDE